MKKVFWHNSIVEAEHNTNLYGGAIIQVHSTDGEVYICTVREEHPRVNHDQKKFDELISVIENSGKN